MEMFSCSLVYTMTHLNSMKDGLSLLLLKHKLFHIVTGLINQKLSIFVLRHLEIDAVTHHV